MKGNRKESLHQFLTFSSVHSVQERNQITLHNDQELCTRLNQELIAIEAKYHNNCYKSYMRSTISEKANSGLVNPDDISFKELIESIDIRLQAGKALQLSELTTEINNIENGTADHRKCSYTTTRLMIKLQAFYGDKISIYKPRNKRQSLWIYSSHISLQSVLDKVTNNQSCDGPEEMRRFLPSDEGVITHAANILLSSLEKKVLLCQISVSCQQSKFSTSFPRK